MVTGIQIEINRQILGNAEFLKNLSKRVRDVIAEECEISADSLRVRFVREGKK